MAHRHLQAPSPIAAFTPPGTPPSPPLLPPTPVQVPNSRAPKPEASRDHRTDGLASPAAWHWTKIRGWCGKQATFSDRQGGRIRRHRVACCVLLHVRLRAAGRGNMRTHVRVRANQKNYFREKEKVVPIYRNFSSFTGS